MRQIFQSSGWAEAKSRDVRFDYVAGADVEEALSFLLEIGPASRIIQAMPEQQRTIAAERMRSVLQQRSDGAAVVFPAAAWIWQARAIG